jgi:hypothetical protein
MKPNSQPELLLIGLGVMIPGHITAQAVRAMSSCSQLYSIVQEPPQLWVPSDKLGGIEVINVLEWYAEGGLRTRNYERVSRKIFESVGRGRVVGYVTYGNPMAYDRVAQNLADYATESGFGVYVVPGISSIDTVFCDLKLDIAPGVQVFDASWLVACQIEPRTDVPLLLLQVGAFGSLRTHYTKKQDGGSLSELVEYSSRFYSRTHIVSLVRSTAHEGQPASIRSVTLGNLCGANADDLNGASLYIPALERIRPNEEIITRMAEI